MNKQEYLSALGRWLRELPEDERKKQLAYYSEMFDDMLEDGLSPAEAAERLGDPVKLAAEILSSLGRTLPSEEGGTPERGAPAKKKQRKALWLALGLVLAVLLLRWGWLALVGLFTFNTARTATETVAEELSPADGKVYSLQAERIHSMEVDWADGSVTILPGEGDKLVFTQSGAGRTADLEWRTDNGTLYIDTGWHFLGAGTTGHLRIQLPRSLAENLESLQVDTASASIAVQGLNPRNLELESASGRIEVTDTAAVAAELHSASGRVTYSGCAEYMEVDTASGAIEVALTGGGSELSLGSASGAITASVESLQEISAENTSGRIDLSIADLSLLQAVEVDTASGAVTLTLPADAAIDLEFDSVSGGLTNEMGSLPGGVPVRVSTVSGCLTVQGDPDLFVGVRGPEA